MSHITSLPKEILLYIVRALKPAEEHFPTSLAWTRRGDESEWNNWWDNHHQEETESSKHYSFLIALSNTNRCFYRLCIPIIYSRVDLFDNKGYKVAMSKSQYVRSLRARIRVNGGQIRQSDAVLGLYQIFSILKTCTNICDLVILYDSAFPQKAGKAQPSPLPITNTIASLLQSGQLKTLAILAYGLGTTGLIGEEATIGPLALLMEIRSQAPTLHHDQQIHLAINWSMMPKYSKSQQTLSSFGYAPTISVETPVYFPPPNLVSLQLMSCGDIHAPLLPDLVLHCPQLQYLFISECGASIGLPRVTRTSGWSEHSEALSKKRKPLAEFHIEHMLEWEILAMGTIPARIVVMTSLVKDDLQKSFLTDPEIFPGLTFLQYELSADMPSGGKPVQDKFHSILARREVGWKADARHRYQRRWTYD
ncbi:hypothetical protein FRC18_008243 [Serendipita sp. 400]|nr:hypothetical protein FRC18_008243 [Serendipita sp. 400]